MEERGILIMIQISSGVIAKAQKVVIYGTEGVGKSTFASQFPDPIFTDTEGSTNNMNVKRLNKPTSWAMLKQEAEFIKINRPCKTWIIDTIDWAERLAIEHLCSSHNKKGIEDFGYGNGYVYLAEELGKFLNVLQEIVDAGINVVLTAHSQIKKFEMPDELGSYDRYELKLGNKKTNAMTSSLVKEWADMILFINYKTLLVSDANGKKRGQGAERKMYATHQAAWDAKNRFGLPDEMNLDYSLIKHIFDVQSSQPVAQSSVVQTQPQASATSQPVNQQQPVNQSVAQPTEEVKTDDVPINFDREEPSQNEFDGIPQALVDLMNASGITVGEVEEVVVEKGYFPQGMPLKNYDPGFIDGVLIAGWEQVKKAIVDKRAF